MLGGRIPTPAARPSAAARWRSAARACSAGGNYAAAIANSGALVFNTISNQTLSGAISGSGSLTQSGPGTLTLSNGGNNYSGGTNVLGGTLFISGASLPSSGTLNVAGGATLSTADGTARTTTVGGLNLSNGAELAMDWGDTLSTAATATAGGNIALIPSGSFTSGSVHARQGGRRPRRRKLLPQQHQLHGHAQRLLDQRDRHAHRRPRR